jgi:hypothetical protein
MFIFRVAIKSSTYGYDYGQSHHLGDYIFHHENIDSKKTTDWFEVMNPSIYWYTTLGPNFINVCLFGLDYNDKNVEFLIQDTSKN